MGLKTAFSEDVLTVWLCGELDHHTARTLREQIDDTAERIRPRELWLNFSGVSFMDSSGVGLIMGRYRLMLGMGGRLCLQEVPEQLKKMMKLAGLDRLPVWENESKGARNGETVK